ncbi:LytR/AlgR family response regulator transcription factor [Lachnoanaerobaculum umeaense]|jgi:hypothetical protein|uniref:Stage 0 sporulation protein A homolog n=1 Tax=Lachnoanaerobaculum umeaense TaxID=617123 RepID=A0A385Q346_9FIRM|nr:LytTR family DNA-binding domain-containing protein [Lachnoanaerobaculum umeaense]AYA99003.1 DNA-binding response regulator [Lachnoanaerobaculum umeaense]PZW95172.1 LytTR family two component transcriptional regulator [Lachnoanaerobaculum umeaense]
MIVVICDDNPIERENLLEVTTHISKSEGYDAEFEVFENAKQMLFELEDKLELIDVILLDINMPGIDGMEAALKLRSNGYIGEIVFTTVSKSHMLGAFDVRAFNYIVKGETDSAKTVRIIKGVLGIASEKSKEYMLFTGIGEYRNIAINDIKYFEVRGKIITVYYGSKSFEFISTIGKLENLLFTKGFLRVHRSFLVSLQYIKTFTYEEVTLIDRTVISVGRKYYSGLKEAMKENAIG